MGAARSKAGSRRWIPRRGRRSPWRFARLEQGNLSNVKSVGEGVLEYRINFGPGYRVYFGRDGETVVILLTVAPRNGSSGTYRRELSCGRITGADGARGERRTRMALTRSFR